MFSGLIKDSGRLISLEPSGANLEGEIATRLPLADLELGASVACSGICLTVTHRRVFGGGQAFAFLASPETRKRTTIDGWEVGDVINLEPSLRLGDSLGGHLVFGHVDAVADVEAIDSVGDSKEQSWLFRFSLPNSLRKLVVLKGSIAVDGISLTVAELEQESFAVAVIAHSFNHTNLGQMKVGQKINLEADMLARYVARQLECQV